MNSMHSVMSRMNPRLVNLFKLGYVTAPQQDLTEKCAGGSRRIYKEVQGTKQMDREQNPEVPLRNLKKGMCSSLRGCVGWHQREGLI